MEKNMFAEVGKMAITPVSTGLGIYAGIRVGTAVAEQTANATLQIVAPIAGPIAGGLIGYGIGQGVTAYVRKGELKVVTDKDGDRAFKNLVVGGKPQTIKVRDLVEGFERSGDRATQPVVHLQIDPTPAAPVVADFRGMMKEVAVSQGANPDEASKAVEAMGPLADMAQQFLQSQADMAKQLSQIVAVVNNQGDAIAQIQSANPAAIIPATTPAGTPAPAGEAVAIGTDGRQFGLRSDGRPYDLGTGRQVKGEDFEKATRLPGFQARVAEINQALALGSVVAN